MMYIILCLLTHRKYRMKFYLLVVLCFVLFSFDSEADEYFFKKIAEQNGATKLIGGTKLLESKSIALQEGVRHNKIIFDGNVLVIPGVCKVNMRSDLPNKRSQSDLDRIRQVKESVGDDEEYKRVQDEDVDFITRAEPLLSGENECDFLYHFAITIASDIIFYNNGWSVIYTSNSKEVVDTASVMEGYKIGEIKCNVIRSNDDGRSDKCIYYGTLDSAYREFYINSVNGGGGWSYLKPSYKEVLSVFSSEGSNEFETTPSNRNNAGEISITYSMPRGNSIGLLSSMEGGETLVLFEENKGIVSIKINYSPD